MKSKTVSIEGEEFKIRRWTVAERLEFLKALEQSKNLTQSEFYSKQIEIVAQNTGLSKAELLGKDGVVIDLLLKEIVEFNTPPLDLSGQSSKQSTEATQT
ncbi:MAG: hypothetical protein ACK4TI_00010 [Nitrososphaerales archaeon]